MLSPSRSNGSTTTSNKTSATTDVESDLPFAPDDLVNGEGPWLNIQEIIRLGFDWVLGAVRDNTVRLSKLEQRLETDSEHFTSNSDHFTAQIKALEKSLAEHGMRTQESVNSSIKDLENRVQELEKTTEKTPSELAQSRSSDRAEFWQELAQRVTVHDANRMVAEVSKGLEDRIERATADFETMLSNKADAVETKTALCGKITLNDMRAALDHKADIDQVNNLLSRSVADFKSEAEKLRLELGHKADNADLSALTVSKADITALQDLEQQLQLKANRSQVVAALKKKAGKDEIDEKLRETVGRTEFSEREAKLADAAIALKEELAILEKDKITPCAEAIAKIHKADATHTAVEARLQTTLNTIEQQIAQFKSTNENFAQNHEKHEKRMEIIETEHKIHRQDTESLLTSHADSHSGELLNISQRIVNHDEKHSVHEQEVQELEMRLQVIIDSQAQDLDSLRQFCESMNGEPFQKVDQNDNSSRSEETNPQATNSKGGKKEKVQAKANLKDVGHVLDLKANIEDVNSVLQIINDEIDTRAPQSEFNAFVSDQTIINASLCAEHNVGRWIWRSGVTIDGDVVPWNVQVVNSNPDNFNWDEDRGHIGLTAPGLYEVVFSFFCRKKPSIQLIINSNAVLDTPSSLSSYQIQKANMVPSHPSGNLLGQSEHHYLALPPNAKLSLVYNGEEGGEGFLGLRKL